MFGTLGRFFGGARFPRVGVLLNESGAAAGFERRVFWNLDACRFDRNRPTDIVIEADGRLTVHLAADYPCQILVQTDVQVGYPMLVAPGYRTTTFDVRQNDRITFAPGQTDSFRAALVLEFRTSPYTP